MAAPAAAVASPALAGKRRIVATTNLVPHAEVEYEWRLTGVTKEFFTKAAVGKEVVSPRFSALSLDWRLELTPNGVDDEDEGRVNLYLCLLSQDATATPKVTLRAGREPVWQLDAGTVFSTRKPPPKGSSTNWGSSEYLSHTQLLANFDAHVPDGVFTVTAVLLKPGSEACTNPIVASAPSLSAGLSALLASGKDADLTLLCGDERIAAHRLLLCMRSPVFAAQLSEGPLQVDATAVPVPPDITAHTLRRLLEFLYKDELEPASPEEATHLLNAADHYDVPRLFAICERTLSSALSVVNAADTLTLADQHSAAALKDAALLFVAANAAAVMASAGWAHLATSRLPLVLETMHTMATGAPPPPPPQVPLTPARGAEGGGAAGEGSNTE
jgi:speckle-type POZ protein